MIEIIGVGTDAKQPDARRPLPKNVRQVGDVRGCPKIYMEDYVVTYLKRLSKPDQVDARGAILFGNTYETDEGPAVFIDGACEAGNLELDMDETLFDDEIWEVLREKGRQYFPGRGVAGWFLSRIGFSVEVNQKIIETHQNNFAENRSVLYMIDALEKEDAIYLCERGQLKRQRGYYIYYEKNAEMQEYMLSLSGGSGASLEERAPRGEIRRDKKIVNSYRNRSKYSRRCKKQDLKIRLIRRGCALLIVVMGAFILGKIGQNVWTISMQQYAVQTFYGLGERLSNRLQSPVEEEIRQADDQSFLFDATEEEDVGTTEEGDLDSVAEENREETALTEPRPAKRESVYYIVKKGDTLAEISRKMYSSDQYVEFLAEANGLHNADEIYEGQEILIPADFPAESE